MNSKKEGFLKLYDLSQFRIFHPNAKGHLTGTEWMALMYILEHRLLYIRFDPKAVNGNTVRIDRTFKLRMFEALGIKEKTYEAMVTKLVRGGIFYRLARGWFMVNPYVFCKGAHAGIVRNIGVFRKSTLFLPARKESPQFLSTPTYHELVAKVAEQNRRYSEGWREEEEESEAAKPWESMETEPSNSQQVPEDGVPCLTGTQAAPPPAEPEKTSSWKGRTIARFFERQTVTEKEN